MDLTCQIKEKGYEIGFDVVGVVPAGDYPDSQFYKKWLNNGYEATMSYMKKNSDKRENVKNLMNNAKSVISCGINYNTDYKYSTEVNESNRGWIARYAWGDDYHLSIRSKLLKLENFIQDIFDNKVISYVDTGPVLERMYARYSGIGWLGKNTCIINQEIGSWLFLGEIITDAELDYDNPAIDRCGTCTECIDKCPTDALRDPYVLDSNRCISFFTIENKEKIPTEYRNQIENNIFGCDICQDVCPWNRKAKFTDKIEFEPREGLFNPELEKLVNLSQEEFSKLFKNSPVKRAKRVGLIRNVLVAIGNSGDKKFGPLILSKLNDADPVIRSQAVWAYYKIENQNCYDTLLKMLQNESEPEVVKEIEYALSKLEEN